jgi:hypothetical protein
MMWYPIEILIHFSLMVSDFQHFFKDLWTISILMGGRRDVYPGPLLTFCHFFNLLLLVYINCIIWEASLWYFRTYIYFTHFYIEFFIFSLLSCLNSILFWILIPYQIHGLQISPTLCVVIHFANCFFYLIIIFFLLSFYCGLQT